MSANIPLDLIKRGVEVFGNKEVFLDWLEKENFFFDKKAPIKFIDERLTGIEYGDNA